MENVRVDSLLGNKKVIVGNPYSDIVLETLGKVYIKSGRNCKLLDDVIKELATITEKPQEEVYAKTIIVNSVDELESLDYPGDGYLIYNSLNKSLYISYEDKYIALIESVADTSENYVKKTGDSMSGQLEITVDAFPPLIVHSKKLVSNFNANYLEGYAAKDLAKKKVDEIISGDWTFTGSNISKANWRFYRDIIVGGSITSPFFSSGFSGSGWRIDATTNTLTIDYLVVRKAMQVYEMVVNKITATNGSLWVSNASKVENFVLAYETTTTEFLNEFNEAYKNASGGTDFTELDDLARSLLTSLLSQRTDIIFTNENVRAYMVGDSSWQCPAILTHIADAYALANSTLFTNINQLWDKSFLDSINIEGPQTPETLAVNNSAQAIDLFSESGPESYMDIVSDDNKSIIKKPLYYSYFYGTENIYVVDFDDDEIPVFKPGDIVRCQKWDNQNIKYYDAIVLAPIGLHSFAIQLAKSVFDKYTEVSYDEKGNISEIVEKYNDNLYDRTDWTPSDDDLDYEGEPVQEEEIKKKLATVEIGDSLVQVGNIKPDSGRQNAIYLTSSDDQAPYINILSDLNRPDYSVLYKIPKYDEEGNPITKKDEEGNFVEYEFEYTKTTKVRIGNLGGIIDYTFPADKQPRGYGLYGQNVYLTGNFYLNNGKSVVDVSQDGVFLKYKEAGLSIADDPKTGDPIISLEANKVWIGDSKGQIGTLFKVEDGKAYINTDFIKAQKIEVQEIWNYSFDETTSQQVELPLFEGTYTPVMYESSIGTMTPDPPYGMADSSAWTGTISKHDGSGVFKDSSLYPGSACFMESVNGEQVHIMTPILSLKNGTLDGKLSYCNIGVNMGDFIGEGMGEIKVTAHSVDTGESWDVPFKMASRGTLVYELSAVETTAATNNLIFAVSLIPASKEDVRRIIVNISVSYYYHEGALNWALWKNGSGSLAREKINWNKDGELTINGDFRSSNGQTTILMGNNSKSAYLSMFSNATEEHPLLYIRYRNVGSGNSVTVEVDSEYTHDDIYYSRARLTCEGLTFGYTQKGYLDSIITSGMGYISMDKYNGFQMSNSNFSFAAAPVVQGVSIVMGGKAFTIRPDGGGICFNYGAYPGTGGHAWPTSIDQVSVGGVYIHTSDGSLHVKQS
jgi:hypothetical protein|nr:MAG TPA: tail protein [Caudoviricetes sp.]